MKAGRIAISLALGRVVSAVSCWRNTTCTGPLEQAFPGPWSSNIYAPSSRTPKPAYVLSGESLVSSPYTGSVLLSSSNLRATLDFGKEVGGITSFGYTSNGTGQLFVSWTEAKNYIGLNSDMSNGGSTPDGYLTVNITESGSGTYQVPLEKLRGGFRYTTITFSPDTDATVEISDVLLEIGFQPTWSNLQAYQGYFHCSDEVLNKIWYSGAYTVQTNAVPVDTGRAIPMVSNTWANNGTLGNGSTIIVDGAKRDRAVWPGDMGIAVPTTFYSIGDLESVSNALQTMYDHQNSDGSFPEAGPPLLQQGSDTYHMWSMIGTYNYLLYENDTAFLEKNWDRYLAAMNYIYGKVLPSGLLNVTGIRDWARFQQGFNNSEANMILYRTLKTGAYLANVMGQEELSDTYNERAANLSVAINTYLWDSEAHSFKDNATDTTLIPQDANSMAILFNVTTPQRDQSISSRLTENWNELGAVSPELAGEITPFISSFEIQAHFLAGQANRALDLIRRSWGWYLSNPNGTESTVIEGYLANGSFAYRWDRGYVSPEYTSHSHGWSSGPTSALTNYILGLEITGAAGEAWSLTPQFGDLEFAEGGFTTSLGKYQASWKSSKSGYVVTVSAPAGTQGSVLLPSAGGTKSAKMTINGKAAKLQLTVVGNLKGFATIVHGGNHTFAVEY
ncbi:Six-hairpin glycosidase-like protein [Xylariaceae sp. FL0255]|nr:Six-hairpin glycosidase-like protein [Xylariaceae sp. FL0255]